MSDTTDTHESVTAAATQAAGGDTALTEAVQTSITEPAPASETAQIILRLYKRIAALEAGMSDFFASFGDRVTAIENTVKTGASVAAALAPAHVAAISAIPTLIDTVNGLLSSLGVHFGGKLATPAPIAAPTMPVSDAAG